MKKQAKKLRLNLETLRHLDGARVRGGWDTINWPCPAPEPETRGFTNCEYCDGGSSSDEDG